jgi:hypothetical protein
MREPQELCAGILGRSGVLLRRIDLSSAGLHDGTKIESEERKGERGVPIGTGG